MKLGILGGTFDPPHLGHLVVAQEAIHRLGLDRLLVIPAALPPHKRHREITDGALRLEMARAAFADVTGVEVSDLELRRDGPSYTVDTLRALKAQHPGAALLLFLGADQARELDTWREPAAIRELATVVGFHRAGQEPVLAGTADASDGRGSGAAPGGVLEIEVPRLDISSTEVRRRVAAGEPVRFLVPDTVLAVVRREGLYR